MKRAKLKDPKPQSCEDCQLQGTPFYGECYGFDKYASVQASLEAFA